MPARQSDSILGTATPICIGHGRGGGEADISCREPSTECVPFYIYRHVVGLLETNLMGNVYFSHYLVWQGACREMFLRDHAPDVLNDLHGSLRLITLQCGCRYFAELEGFEEVEIQMRLKNVQQNRVEIGFEYFVNRSGQAILTARGEQQIACMRRGPAGLAPCPIPEQLEMALRPYRAL